MSTGTIPDPSTNPSDAGAPAGRGADDKLARGVLLVACCLIPAFFLPRRKVAPVDPTVLAGY